MGLFDAIREKAGELLSGATEKVSEVVGDVPGVQDVTQSATDAGEQVTGAAEGLGATAGDVAGQAGDQFAGAAEGFGDTATGAVGDLSGSLGDAADTVTGSLPEPPEAYRP